MKYIVEPDFGNDGRDGRIQRFKELRAHLWEVYGPGCELDYVMLRFNEPKVDGKTCSVERWAWDTKLGNLRLYLKGDDELSFIKLKWC